ncbi:MAG: histidine phosphatase family protein [Pseudobdellovibrionaceae bacterium]
MYRFLLMRHGESIGNIDPRNYMTVGDAFLGLTEKGWDQAEAAGRFLVDYYRTESVDPQTWPHIFCSSYQRTRETLSGVLSPLKEFGFSDTPRILEDLRLTEQFYGAVSHLNFEEDPAFKPFAEKLLEISKAAAKSSPVSASLLFGESPKDIMLHTKSFMDGTLSRDVTEGKHDILIVTHGATLKAFLMNWFHLPIEGWEELELPHNCDIIEICGEPKNWQVRKIYDGRDMKPCNINPIENIRWTSLDSLPKRPDFTPPEAK